MKRLTVVLLVCAGLFVGCANDDAPDIEATDAPPTDPVTECTDVSGSSGQADLALLDFEFDPECLQINEGQGLGLHNEGDATHNFSVEGFGLDVDVRSGEENNTEATGLEPGEYTMFCKYHRGSGMEGELRIVEI